MGQHHADVPGDAARRSSDPLTHTVSVPGPLQLATAAALALAAIHPLAAQDREDYPPACPNETEQAPCPGTIVLPPRYDPARAYPVVVLLPFTNGNAELLLYEYSGDQRSAERLLIGRATPLGPTGAPQREFIVILTAGTGSPFDYATGDDWWRTILRYEARVRRDVAALAAAHRIDTTRVVLAGFSLGGDLAWALAVRDPARIRGAVVMGSRASYRARPADHQALARRGARFFFTIGAAEDPARLAGARVADQFLTGLHVAHELREIPGGQHSAAPFPLFLEALDFVLGGP